MPELLAGLNMKPGDGFVEAAQLAEPHNEGAALMERPDAAVNLKVGLMTAVLARLAG